jgi:hypothetical protein
MVMKDAVDTLLNLIDIERLGDRVFTSLTLMRQCDRRDLLLRLARIILRLMQFRYERYILFVFNQLDF